MTLYPSVDENGFHGERQLVAPDGTWKHAEALTAGRFGGNKWQDDLVVRWSDGEVSLYQNGKEIRVVAPGTGQAGTWKHATQITAGDYAGDDTWDLIVRWSDGEPTLYADGNASGIGTEHRLVAPWPTVTRRCPPGSQVHRLEACLHRPAAVPRGVSRWRLRGLESGRLWQLQLTSGGQEAGRASFS